jgi:hypothetical protein
MKKLYTILFYANTLLLVCLTYLFLHTLDQRRPAGELVLIFLGIVASIFLLVVLLKTYLKQPSGKDRR